MILEKINCKLIPRSAWILEKRTSLLNKSILKCVLLPKDPAAEGQTVSALTVIILWVSAL